MDGLQRLLVMVGPTAAGKSSAAMDLAEEIGGEIVSADAVQVYRGLDIGSAKPTAQEQARVRHHVIDIAHPSEPMDAARWRECAEAAIADIVRRGRVPMVVGGTGLYVRALTLGLSPIPDIPAQTRGSIRERVEREGPERLHHELVSRDPAAALRIAPRDGQRIGRALEVLEATGRTLSSWQDEHAFAEPRYDVRALGLWPDKSVLTARIDQRAHRMVEDGWIVEVRSLLARGLSPSSPGLSSLGYRNVVDHLEHRLPGSMLVERVASGHRRYAKRQLTWFKGQTRRDHDLTHLDPTEGDFHDALRRWVAQEGFLR